MEKEEHTTNAPENVSQQALQGGPLEDTLRCTRALSEAKSPADDLSTAWAAMDLQGAKALRELTRTLRKWFATGAAQLGDFPATQAAFHELAETFETEAAVEKRLQLQEKLRREEDAASKEGGRTQEGQKGARRRAVCVMVDGSLQAATALKWAVENMVGRDDDLLLATVIPWQAFSEDAGRILAEAVDYAHHAGVRMSRLHTKTLLAGKNSATGGVGERIVEFVEGQGVTAVVLGSRGLGSIKRSLMGRVGLGSVTDFAIQNLRCAVIIVRELPKSEEGKESPTDAEASACTT